MLCNPKNPRSWIEQHNLQPFFQKHTAAAYTAKNTTAYSRSSWMLLRPPNQAFSYLPLARCLVIRGTSAAGIPAECTISAFSQYMKIPDLLYILL